MRGLKLYYEAGIETRLSSTPILPLNPENFAERIAPFITKRVWIASMNHKHLTQSLFRKYFPDWLRGETVETAMHEACEAFKNRGVDCFYNSLHSAAKRERWERHEAKIEARKTSVKNSAKKSDIKKSAENGSKQLIFYESRDFERTRRKALRCCLGLPRLRVSESFTPSFVHLPHFGE